MHIQDSPRLLDLFTVLRTSCSCSCWFQRFPPGTCQQEWLWNGKRLLLCMYFENIKIYQNKSFKWSLTYQSDTDLWDVFWSNIHSGVHSFWHFRCGMVWMEWCVPWIPAQQHQVASKFLRPVRVNGEVLILVTCARLILSNWCFVKTIQNFKKKWFNNQLAQLWTSSWSKMPKCQKKNEFLKFATWPVLEAWPVPHLSTSLPRPVAPELRFLLLKLLQLLFEAINAA